MSETQITGIIYIDIHSRGKLHEQRQFFKALQWKNFKYQWHRNFIEVNFIERLTVQTQSYGKPMVLMRFEIVERIQFETQVMEVGICKRF